MDEISKTELQAFLDEKGVQWLWNQIKEQFAPKTSGTGGFEITQANAGTIYVEGSYDETIPVELDNFKYLEISMDSEILFIWHNGTELYVNEEVMSAISGLVEVSDWSSFHLQIGNVVSPVNIRWKAFA